MYMYICEYNNIALHMCISNFYRLADHFGGKLHMGFVTIREKMAALEVTKYHNNIIIAVLSGWGWFGF